ncbi:DNA topoisomerase IV subunit A [Lactobacillus sp. S2-2]|uniref:DNA topoisomerase IV subunit A n=1 Tax=Lactobacillus sp. S2-2 TaxID=2692917 RepID=UPI001F025CC9|nr:DNA topoisomerase IV subunit A [Lactobacillus sp. S2-2]MCF6515038.1 DNA topoisomerase IV subunit A [Lactobacillus sp. S2-2]
MSKGQIIENLPLEDVMSERFSRYSKSIIQERALPDVRDGLKPVQRRILFAMNVDGNTHSKSFRKSAKSVGNVMGNYHPHGDSSIYEAMNRMSQDWKLREPLIEMHGNNGSMDGDPPAAMRYTEARLSKISDEMLADIDKGTVDWILNFDDTEYEPVVLPARFPNLLVNGSTGISAGYATDIPPHNLGEVIDAVIYLQKHEDASLDDLMQFIKGPDFPTGGIIQGIDGIKEAYKNGKGKIVVRSKTKIEDLRGNHQQIAIDEIPYEVNKSILVKQIDEIRINKKIDGIAEVRDESDREGLRIAIELKKDVNAEGILKYLFKNTDLQISYNFNVVAINNMRPERMSLKSILSAYLNYQREVVTNRTKFNLKKAQERQHIVEGLIKALSILDQVIKVIRASENKKNARDNLINEFDFSEKQSEAIVSLQLYRLTNTDVTELKTENDNLNSSIISYRKILDSKSELDKVIKKELTQISKNYRNDRRTIIEDKIEDLKISEEITVADEDVMLLVSHDGYLKRSSLRSYKASENFEGILKDEDYPILMNKVNTRDHLYMFTNKGNVIYRPVHEIKDVKWKDMGEHISQSIGLDDEEEIINSFVFNSLEETGKFCVTTTDGFIKLVDFNKLLPGRNYKSKAFTYEKLKKDNANVVSIDYLPDKLNQIFIITKLGYGINFSLEEVSISGAKSTGVKSINLSDDDEVQSSIQINSENDIIGILFDNGNFKKIKITDIPTTGRARKGIKCLKELKSRKNLVEDAIKINENQEIFVRDINDQEIKIDFENMSISDRLSNGRTIKDIDLNARPYRLLKKESNKEI